MDRSQAKAAGVRQWIYSNRTVRPTRFLPVHFAGGAGLDWHKIGDYFIDFCPRCKSKYVRNVPSENELTAFYSRYYSPGVDAFEPSKRLGKRLENWHLAHRVARAMPRVSRGETRRALEIGFGEGHLLRAMAKLPRIEVHGLEYSRETVDYHRAMGLDVACASLMDSHFEAASFDMVIGLHVLEHTQRPERFVAEIQRILKPGGRVYFVVPCATHYLAVLAGKNWKHLGPPGHLWYFSTRGVRLFLERAGYRVLSANCVSNRAHLSVLAEKWA